MGKAQQARALELQQQTGQIPQAQIDQFIKENKNTIADVQSKQTDLLFKQLAEGSIGNAALTRGLTATKNSGTLGYNWYQSFGQGAPVQDFFSKATRISAYGSQEDVSALNEYANDLNKLKAIQSDATKTEEERNDALSRYNQLLPVAIQLMEKYNQQILAQKTLTDSIDVTGLTQSQLAGVTAGAQQRQAGRYGVEVQKGLMTPEEAAAKQKEAQQFLAQTGPGQYTLIPKGTVEQQFFTEELKAQIAAGIVQKPGKQESVGFQSYDLTKAQFTKDISGYNALKDQLVASGYTLDESTQVSIFKDGIIEPMKLDWKIVQKLLGDIADNTKETAGAFNLPDGMVFNIPTDIADMWRKTIENTIKETTASTNEVKSSGGKVVDASSIAPSPQEILAQRQRDLEKSNIIKGPKDVLNSLGISTDNFKGVSPELTVPSYSGQGTYYRGGQWNIPEGRTTPQSNKILGPNDILNGAGISTTDFSPIIDKLSSLQGTMQDVSERPVVIDLTTHNVLYLDARVVYEAFNRIAGLRLSALGGALAIGAGRNVLSV